MYLVQPYLIQRARINVPLAEAGTKLSLAVYFDYMGSAEFEFGALPRSFRALQAERQNWKLRLVSHLTENEIPLRVFSALTDEQFAEYVKHLEEFRKPGNRMRTKEAVHFEARLSSEKKPKRDTDFWWDIDNHVMFSFNKKFMNHLESYVSASLTYMDEQRDRQSKLQY